MEQEPSIVEKYKIASHYYTAIATGTLWLILQAFILFNTILGAAAVSLIVYTVITYESIFFIILIIISFAGIILSIIWLLMYRRAERSRGYWRLELSHLERKFRLPSLFEGERRFMRLQRFRIRRSIATIMTIVLVIWFVLLIYAITGVSGFWEFLQSWFFYY